jgi:dTDP-4-amino-4,6-dideoxygalactose transaminase
MVTRPVVPSLERYVRRLERIWERKWFTNNGDQHRLLEEKLRNYLQVDNISLFNNGTTALILACKSLQLSGDVITTPFTFAATPHTLAWNSIRPVFCDIEPSTFNIDPEKIENAITPETTAILPVHVFGNPCNIRKIQRVADNHDLKVIYDAAHAFGTRIDNTGIGNFGDVTMFSFHATKQFHTAEGGALTYRDPLLKDQLDLLRNFGIKNEEEVEKPGINGKMNELQAALGLEVIDSLEDECLRRKKIFDHYLQKLKNITGIILPEFGENVLFNYQYFVIRVKKKEFGISRDEMYERFREYNVFPRKYFSPLCSDFPCYRNLPSAEKANLPVANNVVTEVLCLPLYGELSIDDVDKISEILISFQEA